MTLDLQAIAAWNVRQRAAREEYYAHPFADGSHHGRRPRHDLYAYDRKAEAQRVLRARKKAEK
jgi:hypothetical protein